ncbi:MAG: class I SAM-dependent methyltransferase, partial [Candidatus Aminicenantes bacterium]|nr:class I SAM-dependent methyltransferase [Candidatus Aminicenantes bacterium]
RGRLPEFMRQAFRVLPPLDKPHILDIGCGSGVPTMELARLSGGQVIGLDIDSSLLDILDKKIKKAGLSDRVTPLKCSMFEMDFPTESFDIIWAEGSIAQIRFSAGLQGWRPFLKPGGFLVVHDEEGNLAEKTSQIPIQGYDLLHSFILDEKVWWKEYFTPLERHIREIRAKRPIDPKVAALLDADQREVEMVRQDPTRCRSVYFVMKKRN